MYDVLVKVISQKGTCDAEHKVGDEWVITDKVPAGICFDALDSISAPVKVLMFGGSFDWEADPDVAIVACPDAHNPLVFELRRLHK